MCMQEYIAAICNCLATIIFCIKRPNKGRFCPGKSRGKSRGMKSTVHLFGGFHRSPHKSASLRRRPYRSRHTDNIVWSSGHARQTSNRIKCDGDAFRRSRDHRDTGNTAT